MKLEINVPVADWISPACSTANKDCSSAKTGGKTTSLLRRLVTRSRSDRRPSGRRPRSRQ